MKHHLSRLMLLILLGAMYISSCTSSKTIAEQQYSLQPFVMYPLHLDYAIPAYANISQDCRSLEGSADNKVYYVDSVRYASSPPEPMKAKIKELAVYKCENPAGDVSNDKQIVFMNTEPLSESKQTGTIIRFK